MDVLPTPVADQILATLNNNALEDRAFTDEMKRLLRPHEQALLSVEILPDYLAYVLLAVRHEHQLKQVIGDPSLN